MKTMVIYYSYSGHTKLIAEKIAAEESADTVEIKDIDRPGAFKAYTSGCFASLKAKTWPIAPIEADFSAYDRLILLSPIWAGRTPPAVNAFLEILPKGKTVSVKLISGSGKSNCQDLLEGIIKAKGCVAEGFEDIRG